MSNSVSKIDRTVLNFLNLGGTIGSLRPDEPIMVLGSPDGYNVEPNLVIDGGELSEPEPDGKINPGNSGGPILDRDFFALRGYDGKPIIYRDLGNDGGPLIAGDFIPFPAHDIFEEKLFIEKPRLKEILPILNRDRFKNIIKLPIDYRLSISSDSNFLTKPLRITPAIEKLLADFKRTLDEPEAVVPKQTDPQARYEQVLEGEYSLIALDFLHPNKLVNEARALGIKLGIPADETEAAIKAALALRLGKQPPGRELEPLQVTVKPTASGELSVEKPFALAISKNSADRKIAAGHENTPKNVLQTLAFSDPDPDVSKAAKDNPQTPMFF